MNIIKSIVESFIIPMIKFIQSFFDMSYAESKRVFYLLLILSLLIGVYFGAEKLIPVSNEPEIVHAWLDSIGENFENHAEVNYKNSYKDKVQNRTFFKKRKSSKYHSDFSSKTSENLFVFNPNTADSLSFIHLGLKDWVVENILQYRNRGAYFYVKKDFKKIYKLPDYMYEKLETYIDLPETFSAFELNEADSLKLKFICVGYYSFIS